MPVPQSCPACGSPRSDFRRKKSGAVVCGVCGEVLRPAPGAARPAPARRSAARDYDDGYGDDHDGGDYRRPRRSRARERLNGPATFLIVVGSLGILQALGSLAFAALGFAVAADGGGGRFAQNPDAGEDRVVAAVYLVLGLVQLVGTGLVLTGGVKMKNGESYGMALTAAISACVPCFGPCGIIGIVAGVWSLVVLLDEDVKRVFR